MASSSEATRPPPLTLPVKVGLAALTTTLLLQRDLQPRSMGMALDNPLRRAALAVARSPLFEAACLCVILANCFMLSIFDPMDPPQRDPIARDPTQWRNIAVQRSEDYFQALFTLEMLIKVVAFGWLGRGPSGKRVGYLADPWNYLDGLIVVAGFLGYIGGGSSISALRTVRVLRPLKSLAAVPSMRMVVKSVLLALPSLGNVVILLMFSLIVASIVGLQLWGGLLQGQCAYTDPVVGGWVPTGAYCALPCDAQRANGVYDCTVAYGDPCNPELIRFDLFAQLNATNSTAYSEALVRLGLTPSDPAPTNFTVAQLDTRCMPTANPNKGLVSFDDIGHAALTIFTGITLEGWTDTMYATQRTWGVKWIVALYWILWVVFCAFFVVQLALAVIWETFQQSQESEEETLDKLLDEHAEMLVDHFKAARANSVRAVLGRLAAGAHLFLLRDKGRTAVVPAGSVEESKGGSSEGELKEQLVPRSGIEELTALLHKPKVVRSKAPLVPWLSAFTSDARFSNFMTTLIVLNTLQLAMPYAGMSDGYSRGLDIANFVFSAFFGLELILKLVGDGPALYLSENFHKFDCAVVLLSFLDIAMTATVGAGGGGLSALRTFRLARVFKLAKSWPALRRLIKVLSDNIANFQAAIGVLVLVLFIFTLLCMQLFGGGFPADATPRANYDTLWIAFVSTFQTASGENWNVQLAAGNFSFGATYLIIIILCQLICSLLFLNLFLAILLGAFESAAELKEKEAAEAEAARRALLTLGGGSGDEVDALVNVEVQLSGSTQQVAATVLAANGERMEVRVLASGDVKFGSAAADAAAAAVGSHTAQAFRKLGIDSEPLLSTGGFAPSQRALFCLTPANQLRQLAAVIVASPWFDNFVLLLIAISSLNLALDEPRIAVCKDLPASDPGSCAGLAAWLAWSDIIITALFVLEMVLKVFSLGFVLHNGSYLRSGWNVLDFCIVIVSVTALAMAGVVGVLKALKAIRALRALRPLRAVSRFPGLKLVVSAVMGALPKASTVLVINLLFLLLLAIVGLQNWMGNLNTCNDYHEGFQTIATCVGSWTLYGDDCGLLPHDAAEAACRASPDGAIFPRLWVPQQRNFDNVFSSLMMVFEVADGEGWPDLMWPVVDAPADPTAAAARDTNVAAALYFIVIQVVSGFFLFELFTGVVIANYYALKAEAQGSVLLTKTQQKWVEQTKLMLTAKAGLFMKRPYHPENERLEAFRYRFFRIARSKYFEWIIMVAIILNTVVLGMTYYGHSAAWGAMLEIANSVFAAIFIAEATIKLIAYGPVQYFGVVWNRFDFLLVLGSILGWALSVGPITTLLRIFRVARIFRMVRTSRGLLVLFRTLIISMPALLNVGIVLVLVFFIFAVIGMNLFAGIRYSASGSGSPFAGSGSYGPDANFDSFWTAVLTLFRCSTGEDWNGIMHSLRIQPPYCLDDDAVALCKDLPISDPGSCAGAEPNCGSPHLAPVFFTLFSLCTTFILIKLLVAVVMDAFSDMLESEKATELFKLTPDVVEAYAEAWAACDPSASRFLRLPGLVKLMNLLPHPLGVMGAPPPSLPLGPAKIALLALEGVAMPPDGDGRYQFYLVLEKLLGRAKRVSAAAATRPEAVEAGRALVEAEAADAAEAAHAAAEAAGRADASRHKEYTFRDAAGRGHHREYTFQHTIAAYRLQCWARNKAGKKLAATVVLERVRRKQAAEAAVRNVL